MINAYEGTISTEVRLIETGDGYWKFRIDRRRSDVPMIVHVPRHQEELADVVCDYLHEGQDIIVKGSLRKIGNTDYKYLQAELISADVSQPSTYRSDSYVN